MFCTMSSGMLFIQVDDRKVTGRIPYSTMEFVSHDMITD